MVLISSFDPVRREVAKLALEALVRMAASTRPASRSSSAGRGRTMDLHVAQIGEEAVDRLKRFPGCIPRASSCFGKLPLSVFLHPERPRPLHRGRAALRDARVGDRARPTSPNAPACSTTFGKSIEANTRQPRADWRRLHPPLRRDRHRGQRPVAAHHNEVEAGDGLRGARDFGRRDFRVAPGARAESMTSYIERLGRLEKLAMTMPGVQQAFAIQAPRGARGGPASVVTDDQAHALAKTLRSRSSRSSIIEHHQGHGDPGQRYTDCHLKSEGRRKN